MVHEVARITERYKTRKINRLIVNIESKPTGRQTEYLGTLINRRCPKLDAEVRVYLNDHYREMNRYWTEELIGELVKHTRRERNTCAACSLSS